MNNDPKSKLPEEDWKDKGKDAAIAMLKGVVSSVVPFGGIIAEMVELLSSSAEKRQREWLISILNRLDRLEKKFKTFNFADIVENPVFLSAFLQAYRYAVINHNQENLEALRNAVLNSALPESPDETSQKMFITWAGELTAWHIHLLRLFEDRAIRIPSLNLSNPELRGGLEYNELAKLIETRYPEMKGGYDVYMLLVYDLHASGLIANLLPEKDAMTYIESQPVLTPVARRFLQFVSSPMDEK